MTTGEDRAYAFTADDFGFDDDDAGATLASVTIVTPPMVGTLALDGTAVMADDVVTKAQIDADMLTFTPARDAHGDPYTTFTFTVNDGTDDSASAYTMTIDVTDAPLPVCAVPDIAGAGRREIWSGTVTVEEFSFMGSVTGYGFDGVLPAGTLLPSQSFFIGSNNYVIDAITVSLSGSLHFSLDGFSFLTATETAALRLHVCDGDYDFSTANNSQQNTTPWSTTLDWSPPVETRTVYLSLPANNDATGEPAITGTAQAGQDLTADASPIMDTDGLPSSFTYQWVRVDADGMSNPADITDATAATYTLTAADAGKKIKVQVSFTDELSGEEERTSAAYPSSGTVTSRQHHRARADQRHGDLDAAQDDGHLRRARAHRVLDDLRRAGDGDRRSDLRLRPRRPDDGVLVRGLGHHHAAVLPRRDGRVNAATGTRTGLPGPRTRLRSTAAPSRGQTTRWRRS